MINTKIEIWSYQNVHVTQTGVYRPTMILIKGFVFQLIKKLPFIFQWTHIITCILYNVLYSFYAIIIYKRLLWLSLTFVFVLINFLFFLFQVSTDQTLKTLYKHLPNIDTVQPIYWTVLRRTRVWRYDVYIAVRLCAYDTHTVDFWYKSVFAVYVSGYIILINTHTHTAYIHWVWYIIL